MRTFADPDDAQHFDGHLWHRMQYVRLGPVSRDWPQEGAHVDAVNEYNRLDALDIPAAEKTEILRAWLCERSPEHVVDREIAHMVKIVRRFDDVTRPASERPQVKPFRVVAPGVADRRSVTLACREVTAPR